MTRPRQLANRTLDFVSVLDLGADPTGASDSSPASATGGSTLTVNAGKALAAGQWVEYTYNLALAAWFETAYGTL